MHQTQSSLSPDIFLYSSSSLALAFFFTHVDLDPLLSFSSSFLLSTKQRKRERSSEHQKNGLHVREETGSVIEVRRRKEHGRWERTKRNERKRHEKRESGRRRQKIESRDERDRGVSTRSQSIAPTSVVLVGSSYFSFSSEGR